MASENVNRAVFLDRDGTIIEDMEFSTDPARLRPYPGTAFVLRQLQDAGYLLILVTNQSGVARGRFTEAELQAFHEHLVRTFDEMGVRFAGVCYCPHYEEGKVEPYAVACDCRKPEPGMLLRAAQEHRIDPSRSWMIGDRPADVGAGQAAGCRTIRVLTGGKPEPGDPEPDYTVKDLAAAAEVILSS